MRVTSIGIISTPPFPGAVGANWVDDANSAEYRIAVQRHLDIQLELFSFVCGQV